MQEQASQCPRGPALRHPWCSEQLTFDWCRSFPQLPPEHEDATEEELNQERYADLDYSKESELEHIAGWFNPEAAVSEGKPLASLNNTSCTPSCETFSHSSDGCR